MITIAHSYHGSNAQTARLPARVAGFRQPRVTPCAGAPPAVRPKPAQVKAAVLTADQRSKNVDSFDMIWTTIRDKHFDAKLGGLDWTAVHDELRPKVERRGPSRKPARS